MEQPNWFDVTFADAADSESIESLLRDISKNPRIVTAVKVAIAQWELDSSHPGWEGPSKTQVVRNALAAILNAS